MTSTSLCNPHGAELNADFGGDAFALVEEAEMVVCEVVHAVCGERMRGGFVVAEGVEEAVVWGRTVYGADEGAYLWGTAIVVGDVAPVCHGQV